MKKIVLSALLLATTVAFAQESKVSVSGTVDMYGTTNFADGTGTPGILVANPQNANRFGLGSINTVFAYEGEKSGFVADLAFGPRADAANLADAINQLYAYYNVNDKTTITAGQFNTFLGYEVISPAANFNYTVSYLFNAGPFSHTGIKLDYAASEDLSYMLAVTNPHGFKSDNVGVTGETQYGAQVGYKGQYLNAIYGADGSGETDVLYLDYTGGFDLTDSLYLGINAAYSHSEDGDTGYQGAALYIENTFSDSFALGLRPEFFQKNGASDATVTALTLAASSSLTDNLKVITELRMDSSEDGEIAEFAGEESVSALTIAAVYSF
jgi:hypothetical protein